MRNLKTALLRRAQDRKQTVFQGFWHGPSLGPLLHACLASFVGMGHSFELYTYDRVTVPAGVRLRDAGEIISRSEVFYFDNPITGRQDIAPFADLFRLKLLLERGGWWSDVDTICLSRDIPMVGRAWAQENPEWKPGAIGNSQIAFDPGDPVVAELYQRCLALSKTAYPKRESLGPHLISAIVRELGLPADVFGTPNTFYPIRWIEMFKLWLPQFKDEIEARAKEALFMPIYASFPQYIGLDLGKLPPPGSFLSDLCERYLKHELRLPRYLADDIVRGTRTFLTSNKWPTDELAAVSGEDVLRQLGIRASASAYKGIQNSTAQLTKIDNRRMDFAPDDILCVLGVRNELLRLPYLLDYHRKLGVNRFLCLDNGSDDGTPDYLLAQDDCHCFHTEGSHFAMNVEPPNWTNAVLNTYCEGHWCVLLDGDELLVYPGSEHVRLRSFCSFLERDGANAMSAAVVDMYADGPATGFTCRQNQPFIDAAPYFDPKPGWVRANNGSFPPVQMFGGVRERLFWQGRFKQTMPPCLTTVPLVKWERGMRYLIVRHFINHADLAIVTGALLHFKFLTGFQLRAEIEVLENSEVEEKGLQERKVYLDVLTKQPNLTFRNSESVKFAGSNQLIELGWMKSTPAYDDYLARSVYGARNIETA